MRSIAHHDNRQQPECMKFLRIIFGCPEGARKWRILFFAMLLHSKTEALFRASEIETIFGLRERECSDKTPVISACPIQRIIRSISHVEIILSILKECPANVNEPFLTGHVAAAVSGAAARGCPRSRCGIDPQAKRLGVGASLCTDGQNIRFGDDFDSLHRRIAVYVAVSANRTGMLGIGKDLRKCVSQVSVTLCQSQF